LVSHSRPEGWLDSTNPYLDIETMIKNKSIITKCCRYIKDLRDLRKYTNKKRQIEIDKEINELQKLKEDVKKIRSNF